jgi:hypothetical protein
VEVAVGEPLYALLYELGVDVSAAIYCVLHLARRGTRDAPRALPSIVRRAEATNCCTRGMLALPPIHTYIRPTLCFHQYTCDL